VQRARLDQAANFSAFARLEAAIRYRGSRIVLHVGNLAVPGTANNIYASPYQLINNKLLERI